MGKLCLKSVGFEFLNSPRYSQSYEITEWI